MIVSRRTLNVIAAVAGGFVIVVGAALWVRAGVGSRDDPLDSDALYELNQQLAQSPGDEPLRRRIRELDVALRTQFFQRQRSVALGAWLLLGGAIVAVGAAKLARPPARDAARPTPPATTDRNGAARHAVAGIGGLLLVGGLLLWMTTEGRPTWPTPTADAAPAPGTPPAETPPPEAPPDPAAVVANWPAFRGPGGLGEAPDRQPPLDWDVPEQTNVRWTAAIDLPGHSSPIVWGDRVFVTAATASRRVVRCYGLDDGAKLWEHQVNLPGSADRDPPEVMEDTGYAAPTPATDGRRVYAIFANGDLIALDFDGNEAWHHAFGTPSDMYGHSNSLICHDNRVIVQFDQFDEDRPDTVTCFDGPTGAIVWQAKRDVEGSWASPCLAEAGGRAMLITIASPWAIAYDPADGTELWRVDGFHGDVATSPTVAGDRVILAAPGYQFVAVEAGAAGEATDAPIAWRSDELVPDVTSPVADETHLYALTTFGDITARRLSDGKIAWQRVIDADFRASPILAAGRLYLFDNDGRGYVLDPADGGDLGGGPVGGRVAATPAFVGGRIVVRSETGLVCLEGAEP